MRFKISEWVLLCHTRKLVVEKVTNKQFSFDKVGQTHDRNHFDYGCFNLSLAKLEPFIHDKACLLDIRVS